jgi:plasmid stabilization system protein ParE
MNVEYSKRAISDLRQIAAYYTNSDDVAVGEKIASAVRDLVSRIAEAPQWGQAVWKQREIAVLADSALGEAALES